MHALTSIPLLALCIGGINSQQEIFRSSLDFSRAEADPATGELCILQRVCLANPAALAERLPREPCPDPNANNDNGNGGLPDGCDCATDADCGGGDARCVACVCKACPVSTASSTSGGTRA